MDSTTGSTTSPISAGSSPRVLNGWGSDALLQTYAEERQPIFRETAEDFILGRIRTDRDFLERYNPDRDREEFERAWREPRPTPPRAR